MADGGATHTVKPGDTLSAIAPEHGVPWPKIAEANGLSAPYTIYPGQTLVIPKPGETTAPAPLAGSPAQANAPLVDQALRSEDFAWTPPAEACQGCPMDKDSEATTPPCCVHKLTIGCGHAKRSFRLTPPDSETNEARDQIIQVIAEDDNIDTISVTLDGGPCVRGKPTGSGKGAVLQAPGDGRGKYPAVSLGPVTGLSPYKVELQGPEPPGLSDGGVLMSDFLSLFIGTDPGAASRTYQGAVTCCDGGGEYGFQVQVFPKRSWKGEVSIGWSLGIDQEVVEYSNAAAKAPDEPEVVHSAILYKLDDKGGFKIKGKIEAAFGDKTTEVKLPNYSVNRNYAHQKDKLVFANLRTFFEKSLPRLHRLLSSPLVQIEPVWPELIFGGECTFEEAKAHYDVVSQGKIYFKGTLFGMSGKTDILDWVLFAAASGVTGNPQFALELVKIKEDLEKGYGNDNFGAQFKAAIELSATGKVAADASFTWAKHEKNEAQGGITPSVEVSIKGEVSGELRAFIVSVGAGAEIEGKTGISGNVNATFYGDKPGLGGKLTLMKCEIVAVWYVSVGGTRTTTKDDDDTDETPWWDFWSGWSAKDSEDSKDSKDIEVNEKSELLKIVLWEEASWPGDDDDSQAALGGGGSW